MYIKSAVTYHSQVKSFSATCAISVSCNVLGMCDVGRTTVYSPQFILFVHSCNHTDTPLHMCSKMKL